MRSTTGGSSTTKPPPASMLCSPEDEWRIFERARATGIRMDDHETYECWSPRAYLVL